MVLKIVLLKTITLHEILNTSLTLIYHHAKFHSQLEECACARRLHMHRNTRFSLFILLLILVVIWRPMTARADVNSSILGIVSDSSARVVPNAAVKLTNSSTGYERNSVIDANGGFEFLSVPIGGGYAVQVSAPGFQMSTQQGITLLVNQRFRADFVLTIGKVTQQVSVEADAVQVDTATNQLGDVISDQKMIALPLNGRSYTDLMGLQPGVVPITSSAAFTDRPVS